MLIGLSDAMTPFDFGFATSKVKVTRVTCNKNVYMVFALYFENYLSHSFYISHADWSW